MAPDYFPPTIHTRAATTTWARKIVAAAPLVLDCETTGLGPTAEIVEIGVLAADGAPIFHSLVQPQKSIPPSAAALHGITDAMVATAPPWPVIWPRLADTLANRIIVCYNASFDIGMLAQEARRHALALPPMTPACLKLAYACWKGEPGRAGQFRWHTLAAACVALGIPHTGHRALADAEATRLLLVRLAVEA